MNKIPRTVPLEKMLPYQELQVLKLLVNGNTMSEISKILGFNIFKIEILTNTLFSRFETDNITSLIEEAKNQKVIAN